MAKILVVDDSSKGCCSIWPGRGGAGLGLAIANRLVEAQGGILMVQSREGAGSQFTVALPKEA